MCFKKIYEKVNTCLNYDVYELLKKENIDIVRDDDMTYGRQALIMSYDGMIIIFLKEGLTDQEERNLILHELGHFYFDKKCSLYNKRTEENNANLFMCLYLLKNDIWNDLIFYYYLIDQGIEKKTSLFVNDQIIQYRFNQLY